MSIASVAAQQAATSTTSGTAANSDASSTTSNPLASLSGNFNNFLQMLMTQLQNQDPSDPTDTSQFTTELVQFSGVEQQIDANTNLTQLIQLTQSSQVLNSAAVVGHQVAVTSTQMPLQNSQAEVEFNLSNPAPVTITVTAPTGAQLLTTTVAGTSGSNQWSWNGQSANGVQEPDGAYNVTVTQSGGAAVPFNVVGTVTGIDKNSSNVQLQLGSVTTDFSALQSMVN